MRSFSMRSPFLALSLMALCSFLASVNVPFAFCQATTAAMHGIVTDSSGAVVQNATVTALNTATGISTETTSNKSGFFTFPVLQVGGPYTVEVESAGFEKFAKTGILLNVNANLEENATLQVGTTLQTITIDASTPQVETSNTQLEQVVPASQLENLPMLGRDAAAMARLAPGVEAATGWKYWGFDPTPAPLMADSIAAAMEGFGPQRFGAPGTMTAAWVITESEHHVPEPRVGYSGLMLPVLEDTRMAQRWSEGAINMDALLAYSSVCATGLDTVPLPGDVTEAQLARIMGDVAVLAYKWKKPLTARLQPVHGARAGEMTKFESQFLTNARLQPLP